MCFVTSIFAHILRLMIRSKLFHFLLKVLLPSQFIAKSTYRLQKQPLKIQTDRNMTKPRHWLRKALRVISIVKTFQGILNLTNSADLHGFLAPEESPQKLGKPRAMLSKTLSLNVTRSDLTLTFLNLKIFRNFVCEKPRQPPRHNS